MNDVKLSGPAVSPAPADSLRPVAKAPVAVVSAAGAGEGVVVVKSSSSRASEAAVYDRSGVVSAPAQGAEAAEAGELANAAAAKSAQGSEKKAQVQEAVARLNDYVQSVQRDLQFELDEGSGRSVIQVVDRKTQEVVRQIPDELVLKMARSLQQDEPLTLLNAKV